MEEPGKNGPGYLRNIVVIGASGGGIEPLLAIAGSLDHDLPAAVLVVVHTPITASIALPQMLSRRASLPASHACHGESIEEGRNYVGPPGRHLVLHDARSSSLMAHAKTCCVRQSTRSSGR